MKSSLGVNSKKEENQVVRTGNVSLLAGSKFLDQREKLICTCINFTSECGDSEEGHFRLVRSNSAFVCHSIREKRYISVCVCQLPWGCLLEAAD